MNSERIMEALGKVNEDYIMESAPGKKRVSRAKIRWIAAAVAVAVILAFSQIAPIAAALDTVKETITNFIETMFPPKDITVTLEGQDETVSHVAGMKEPQVDGDGTVTEPGFVIYYDVENYTMTEENGATYIRPIDVPLTREDVVAGNESLLEGLSEQEREAKIDELLRQRQELYDSLPVREIEIVRLPKVEPADAARSARDKALGVWKNVTELSETDLPEGYFYHTTAGYEWDAPVEDLWFTSDGQGGAFKITARYFIEASEGHGIRFAAMVDTFEVIAKNK